MSEQPNASDELVAMFVGVCMGFIMGAALVGVCWWLS